MNDAGVGCCVARAFRRVLAVLAIIAASGCSVGGCHGGGSAGASPTVDTSGLAVVGSAWPTSDAHFSCPGIADEAVSAIFGAPVSLGFGGKRYEDYSRIMQCVFDVGGDKPAFYVAYGFLGSKWSPAKDGRVRWGGGVDDHYSFEGVDGEGHVRGAPAEDFHNNVIVYGAATFSCGDHVLVVSQKNYTGEYHGDPAANLVNMTRAAVPWLCQGEPIPGDGRTMEEHRPSSVPSPTPGQAYPPATLGTE